MPDVLPLGALGLFWCWERTQWPPGFFGTALQVWGNQHWLLAAGQLNSRGDNGGLIQLLPKWDATSFMVFCRQRSVCFNEFSILQPWKRLHSFSWFCRFGNIISCHLTEQSAQVKWKQLWFMCTWVKKDDFQKACSSFCSSFMTRSYFQFWFCG